MSFRKFCGRYRDIIIQYEMSLLLNDIPKVDQLQRPPNQ